MIELTDHLQPHADLMDEAFTLGAAHGRIAWASWANTDLHDARHAWAAMREAHGFGPSSRAPLLTPPGHNTKLKKGETPAYGLTLQHYVQRITKRLVVNACPNAGDCTKVCVLDNGNGMFDAVQQARRLKTSFLAQHPAQFSYLLGWELAKAVHRHGEIFFRPNVNSDVAWERLLPSLTSGAVFAGAVTSYGYTKRPEVLDTDGWVGPAYRVAYSWNETSDVHEVARFRRNGGSVAIVTSRQRGAAVPAEIELNGLALYHSPGFPIVDADLTDEWVFGECTIGDLSAKGKARRLIGKSGFVVTVGAS
jgi:hypothetical protein